MYIPTFSSQAEPCDRCGRDADDHVGDVCVRHDHGAAGILPWELRSVQLSGAVLERRRTARRLTMANQALD
jgi:hypothetical protein